MSNPLVKVVNKNKDGVTVRSLDGAIEQELSWEDLNRYFRKTDYPYIYEMIVTRELREESDKIILRHKWLAKYLPQILIIMRKKESNTVTATDFFQIGHIIEEYRNEFPYANSELFVSDIQHLKNVLYDTFMHK